MIFDYENFSKDLKHAYRKSDVFNLDDIGDYLEERYSLKPEEKITRHHMKRLFNEPNKSRISISNLFVICDFLEIDLYKYVL